MVGEVSWQGCFGEFYRLFLAEGRPRRNLLGRSPGLEPGTYPLLFQAGELLSRRAAGFGLDFYGTSSGW